MTQITQLTSEQQVYLNGAGPFPSPFSGADKAFNLDFGDLLYNIVSQLNSGAVTSGSGINVQSLTGALTLVATDAHFQKLNPNGGSRNVTLPAVSTGAWFFIANSGATLGQLLTVKNPAAATLKALDVGESAFFVCSASAWAYVPGTLRNFGSIAALLDSISESTSLAGISLLKALCLAGGDGVNVETLASNKILVVTDAQFQSLSPNAGNRDVTLPANKKGLFYVINNNGGTLGQTLTVKKPAGATLFIMNTAEFAIFVNNGTDWYLGPRSLRDYGALGLIADRLAESTAGAGITLPAGQEIVGVPKTIKTTFTYNTSGALFTVPAGENWLISDVWTDTTVSWNGNGTAELGVTADTDGFLACSNAALKSTYDETGGVAGWPTGSNGLQQGNRGALLNGAGGAMRFRLAGGESFLLATTPGTSTTGTATVYITYTRLP